LPNIKAAEKWARQSGAQEIALGQSAGESSGCTDQGKVDEVGGKVRRG